MVEMALLMPLLLALMFAIIDMGWYIYGFATISQAARNGAEVAAQLPPFEATLADAGLIADDPCYFTIVDEVQEDASLYPLTSDNVTVRYPDNTLSNKRDLGNPIEVAVVYDLEPLTPLFQWLPLGNNGRFTITASAVRSIESLGNTPASEENPNGVACR
jgi:Flp pilus assembly protein TadG